MKASLIDFVCCSVCGNSDFQTDVYSQENEHILEGRLFCLRCRNWFRIEGGLLDLLPLHLRRRALYEAFITKYGIRDGFLSKSTQSCQNDQINFFTTNSKKYDHEITQSPYFSALDKVVFDPWMRQNLKIGSLVLEVGCGTGRQSMPMASHGARVIGVDVSEEMLYQAQKRAKLEKVETMTDFIVADAEALPLKNSAFDACVMIGALHHVDHPAIVISQAASKLKPRAAFFSYDPHKSPARFIFDFLMRIRKLYEEEARQEPLLKERDLIRWLATSRIKANTRISTFLPPHFFYGFHPAINRRLLFHTDRILNAIPFLRKLGGMVIVCGYRQPQ